ncbi:3-dehydroquinate synthase [mine drainage metagenome]|uniref:3-dehydroquinate synthase n=1 Tax=mine drainage metagenome TaxID=410659 RepID=A0A1J5TA26_9ZZZZ
MKKQTFKFSTASTDFYFDATFKQLKEIVSQQHAIIITDQNIFDQHTSKFKGWNTIVLNAGEEYKVQATVDSVIQQLIELNADRKTTLIGVGGGVITDITGYVAAIFMRGIQFGFVPTTLLAMVDASIGGKNGIDVGVYKNMVGIIRQPNFLLYDVSLLKTLPDAEWSNGFAEIIKHACIKDAAMFKILEQNNLQKIQRNKKLLSQLIERNAKIKIKVVQNDEFEKGERRLLNYGHTLGHALENQYELFHGQAVAIGMTYASVISQQLLKFKQTDTVVKVLEQYGLPTYASFDKNKVMSVLKMDKKRVRKDINYILLEKIGKGIVLPIPLDDLQEIINKL